MLGFIQELALVDQKRRLGSGIEDIDQSMASLATNDPMNEQENDTGFARMVNPVPRRGVDPAMTIAAMRLLERSCRIPGCAAMMGEMGAMKSLVALFSLSFGEQDDTTTEFRTICASIVADLCDPDAVTVLSASSGGRGGGKGSGEEAGEDDAMLAERRAERRASVVNQKLFRRAGGVDMVRLALDVTSDELAIRGPRLCMSLVDLAWRAVVGNRRSEAIFVAEDGVDTLLNLVEQVPSSMHRQVRVFLVVLCVLSLLFFLGLFLDKIIVLLTIFIFPQLCSHFFLFLFPYLFSFPFSCSFPFSVHLSFY